MWRKAIENHKILMKERTDASYWSDNIVDATECLENDEDWKKFYMYLCNSPTFFNIDNPRVGLTLGELKQEPQVPPYASNQIVEVVKNGSDVHMEVSTKFEEDDEKHPL